MNLATLLFTALCACSPGGTENFSAELAALEQRCAQAQARAVAGGPADEALPVVRELEALAKRAPEPGQKIAAWGELARRAGTLDTLGASGARELCQKALAALLELHDRSELAGFLERFGQGNALALGLPASQEFLRQLRAKAQRPELRQACDAAAALARFEAVDGLSKQGLVEMRESLAHVASTQARSRWGRRAEGALYYWDHLRIQGANSEITVPEFTGFDDEGRALQLSSWRGQVIVLDFWREDRPECRAQLEREQRWARAYAGRPLVFVGVNGDEEPGLAARLDETQRALLEQHGRPDDAALAALSESEQAFFRALRSSDAARVHAAKQRWKLSGPQLVDGGPDGSWSRRWNVQEWPTVYVIDAQGHVRYRNLPPNELELALGSLVAEAEKARAGSGR